MVTNINYIKDKSMKLNLEQEDLKLIAKDVAKTLKPLFRNTKKSGELENINDCF
jgi:hypothetical protein